MENEIELDYHINLDNEYTYEKILANLAIPESTFALRIFRWLSYTQRTLSVHQLQELNAIKREPPWGIDLNARSKEPNKMLGIGPPFIKGSTKDDIARVEFAHPVLESYLASDRILKGPAARFAITPQSSHAAITQDCISYLLNFKDLPILNEEQVSQYPLLEYAAKYWGLHARLINDARLLEPVNELIM